MNIIYQFLNLPIFGVISNELDKLNKVIIGEINSAGPQILFFIMLLLVFALIGCGIGFLIENKKGNKEASKILKRSLIGILAGFVVCLAGWAVWVAIIAR
ncbi:hypothetical protein V2P24_01110 [Mycoplasma putrefaciens]|uniref:hypothetical protein n=1 Tax=Mycoplasma putrefaciens TaxID=2123 RepID=UPI003DA40367